MCTAVSYKTKKHYFGRNLDLERGYSEGMVITPRNFHFSFRCAEEYNNHYALIGMAAVVNNYPLYFEATNEKGLSMAGLNFPQNAYYGEVSCDKENIAPFELIPYVLGRCDTVDDATRLLNKVNIVDLSFSDELPNTPLHWIVSDSCKSITFECTEEGQKIYDNPLGVLTNNPTFDYHLTNINNYMGLHEGSAGNAMCPNHALSNYSLGMGALGLPGDFSSASRFVKAVFVKEKSVCDGSEKESVNQFFHILRSVAMPKGCVMTASGEYEYTRYSSCCNTDTQTYYYTTYNNSEIKKVDMHTVKLDGDKLYVYPIEE